MKQKPRAYFVISFASLMSMILWNDIFRIIFGDNFADNIGNYGAIGFLIVAAEFNAIMFKIVDRMLDRL